MKIFALTIICISLGFISCNKEKNDNWIFADIYTVDADTKAGIQAEIKLEWRNQKDLDLGFQTIEYGNTNASGIMSIEEKLKGKPEYVSIKARGFDYYAPPYVNELDFISMDINQEALNTLRYEFAPVYKCKIHFNAVDCFDANDSMTYKIIYRPNVEEFDQTDAVTLYGCAETTLPEGASFATSSYYSYDPELTVKYDLWRNGVHSNNTIVFELEKATENILELEY